jgi:hypothetical protein
MMEEIILTKKEIEAVISTLQELPMNKVEMLVNFFRQKLAEPAPELKEVKED